MNFEKIRRAFGIGLLFLVMAALPASAVKTAYCESTYVDDCLQTQRCWYWIDGKPAGSVFMQTECG